MFNCANETEKDGKFYCRAALYEKCKGENCGFYISPEKAKESLDKAYERLRSLPLDEQRSYADKYHLGKMPWKGK